MRKIVKMMRLIVQERSIRLLSILFARLSADPSPGELAFFMDTY